MFFQSLVDKTNYGLNFALKEIDEQTISKKLNKKEHHEKKQRNGFHSTY